MSGQYSYTLGTGEGPRGNVFTINNLPRQVDVQKDPNLELATESVSRASQVISDTTKILREQKASTREATQRLGEICEQLDSNNTRTAELIAFVQTHLEQNEKAREKSRESLRAARESIDSSIAGINETIRDTREMREQVDQAHDTITRALSQPPTPQPPPVQQSGISSAWEWVKKKSSGLFLGILAGLKKIFCCKHSQN